jgi:hypothetical protein
VTTPTDPNVRNPDRPDAAAGEPNLPPEERPADFRYEGTDRHDLVDKEEVIAREHERFGGVKIGSAFFGWLTAVGTVVIITATLAAIGAAMGLEITDDPDAVAEQMGLTVDAAGWIGAIAALVVVFVAYWCGGYVAGRMARFNGVRQGAAVWVWALVIAIVVALLSFAFGARYDVLGDVNVFPRIPVREEDLTLVGIVTAVVVALASLAAAILGGWSGTRYHRRVDRVGLDL